MKFGKNSSVEESAEFCIARAAVGIINDSLWSCSCFQMHLYVAFGLKVLSVSENSETIKKNIQQWKTLKVHIIKL